MHRATWLFIGLVLLHSFCDNLAVLRLELLCQSDSIIFDTGVEALEFWFALAIALRIRLLVHRVLRAFCIALSFCIWFATLRAFFGCTFSLLCVRFRGLAFVLLGRVCVFTFIRR